MSVAYELTARRGPGEPWWVDDQEVERAGQGRLTVLPGVSVDSVPAAAGSPRAPRRRGGLAAARVTAPPVRSVRPAERCDQSAPGGSSPARSMTSVEPRSVAWPVPRVGARPVAADGAVVTPPVDSIGSASAGAGLAGHVATFGQTDAAVLASTGSGAMDGVVGVAPVPSGLGVRRAPVRGRAPIGCPRSSDSSSARGGVRLTRRGRVLASVVAVLVAAVVGWIVVGAIGAAVAKPLIPASAPAVVRVQPGDTLWSIAGRLAPHSDARAVVDALERRNGLTSARLDPGQQLHVPR